MLLLLSARRLLCLVVYSPAVPSASKAYPAPVGDWMNEKPAIFHDDGS